MVKLSIIIPVYNTEKYLSKCIESCLCADSEDFEVILVNDGSTDGSLIICKKYALKDKRVKVIDQKNAGLSSARNSGLKYAIGEYIYFLDSDDFLEEQAVEILLLDTEKDKQLICYNYYEFNSVTQLKSPVCFDSVQPKSYSDYVRVLLGKRNNSNWSAWGKLYQFAFLKSHDLHFDENIYGCEDFQFNFQLISKLQNCYVSNQIIQNYLITNQTSITKNIRINTLLDLMTVFSKASIDMRTKEVERSVENWFYDIYSDWYIFCVIKYHHYCSDLRKELKKKLDESRSVLKLSKTSEAKKMRLMLNVLGYPLSSWLLTLYKKWKGKSGC